jgi:hypothetical protein
MMNTKLIMTSIAISVVQIVNAASADVVDEQLMNTKWYKEYKSKYIQEHHIRVDPNKSPSSSDATTSPPAQSTKAPSAAKTPSYTFLTQLPSDYSKCGGVIFALRRKLSDLGLSGSCPTPYNDPSVNGALFSYGGDAVGHNQTWTVQGLATLLYSTNPILPRPYNAAEAPAYSLEGLTFGPYFQSNTILNSSKTKSSGNTEAFSYGALGGITYAPTSGIGLYHNFEFSLGGTTNTLTHVGSYSQMLQYVPVLDPIFWAPNRIGQLPLYWQFDPSLIAQFDQSSGHGKTGRLAFNNEYNSIRLGPQLMLKLTPNPNITEIDAGLLALERFSATVTYHWAYETVGDRALPLFSAEVDYTLDRDKHFAFSATYQRGNDEITGIYTNQYLLGLTGKM